MDPIWKKTAEADAAFWSTSFGGREPLVVKAYVEAKDDLLLRATGANRPFRARYLSTWTQQGSSIPSSSVIACDLFYGGGWEVGGKQGTVSRNKMFQKHFQFQECATSAWALHNDFDVEVDIILHRDLFETRKNPIVIPLILNFYAKYFVLYLLLGHIESTKSQAYHNIQLTKYQNEAKNYAFLLTMNYCTYRSSSHTNNPLESLGEGFWEFFNIGPELQEQLDKISTQYFGFRNTSIKRPKMKPLVWSLMRKRFSNRYPGWKSNDSAAERMSNWNKNPRRQFLATMYELFFTMKGGGE